MSTALATALQHVDLRDGQVYRCQVKDMWVELRVVRLPKGIVPTPLAPGDVMLDPWTDLPTPEPSSLLRPQSGIAPLPDVPDLPLDG